MSDPNVRWWERRASEVTGGDAGVLAGTITDHGAVVKLRDELERAHIARVVPIERTARVLDLGGGAGRIALWLAPQVREVVLVDASDGQLEVARRRAAREGVDNLHCVVATADAYEPDGLFDLIVVSGLLTHLDEPVIETIAARLSDALAPGGRLVLKEPVSTDGREHIDERRDTQGELLYRAFFRPRERYAEIFGARLPLLYQRPTLAHPIPFFLGGTNEAASRTDAWLAPALTRLIPLWTRLDPLLQEIELQVRATPGLSRLLAPVPVLQDLYVFGAPAPEGAPREPELSVVVIAYCEEECLEAVLDELGQHLEGRGVDFELVLVDDGSTDATLSIMERLAASDPRLLVVPLSPNRGIGGALRAGFDAARGGHITWVPADGQIAPETVSELFERREEAAMLTTVYLSRDDGLHRHLISQTLNTLIRVRSGEVAKSGGNYIFSRQAWEEHAPREDDSMMISTAFRKNLRDAGVPIVEVGVHARARVAGRSKVLNARTILRTLAGAIRIRR